MAESTSFFASAAVYSSGTTIACAPVSSAPIPWICQTWEMAVRVCGHTFDHPPFICCNADDGADATGSNRCHCLMHGAVFSSYVRLEFCLTIHGQYRQCFRVPCPRKSSQIRILPISLHDCYLIPPESKPVPKTMVSKTYQGAFAMLRSSSRSQLAEQSASGLQLAFFRPP